MRRDGLCPAVRNRLTRLPPPFDAHYGVVPLPPPEEAIPLGPVVARVEAALAALGEADLLARTLPEPLRASRILARREAVTSSAIEGTQTTLDSVLSAEEGTGSGADAATRQVRGYAGVLEALLPQAQAAGPAIFTLDLIQELHRAVIRDDPDYRDTPGALRDRVVWIDGTHIAQSTWNPPPPADVPACLEQCLDYLRNEGMQAMTQGLLTRMAVAHAHFEAVHPFRDGNGRVGRLLWPLMMAADGRTPLYLSPYVEAHKAAYFTALKAAQQQLDWAALVGFLADAVVAAVAEMGETQVALAALRALWLGRRRFRAGSAALRALDLLPHYPVLTVNRLADLLGISFSQASQGTRQLVEVGILVERTGQGRNRLFAAPEALAILGRPFGSSPELPQR